MSENAYKQAGVDVEAGYESVRLIKDDVKKTAIEGVLGGIGGFGGLFEMPKNYENPVLVSGTDGVGTKIRVAFLMDKHDTIGQDCVAMCVNDIACSGAKPLFFLDYIAIGKNVPEKVAQIVKGVADGCVLSGCALVGGETAEHPGMMPEDEYDLAGFTVGVVDKKDIITGENLKAGDVLIGMASTGEFANIVSAVYDYLDSGSAAAAYLKTCMLAADHDILYVPDGVPAAKKYGSWDYAYHDVAIVYAKHPYWIVCMTDQGDENLDFPEEPTQAMQTLGQLVYEYWNP